MKPVYIHIGLPKTGTTALQNWLERNSHALRKKGVFTFDRVELAHRLAAEGIINGKRKARADIADILNHDMEGVTGDLSAALSNKEISKIFISSEYFTDANASTVKRILSAIGINNVTIIVTLRRQDRFIESAYSQEVFLMGQTEPIAKPHYAKWYNWHLLVSSWARAFDKKIEILIYDSLIEKGQAVNNEIIKKVDASLRRLATKDFGYDEKSNLRIPAKILEFKRLANRLGGFELQTFVSSAIEADIDRTKFRMDSEQAKAYVDLYRRSNRAVARDFLHLKGDLFDEIDLSRVRTGVDYTGRLPVEVLTALFALYVKKNGERLAQISGVHEDSEIRRLINLVRERDLKLAEADRALEKLLREAAERDRQLMEADGTLRKLLKQIAERDCQLVEADGSLRKLLKQIAERDCQLVEADGSLRKLLQRTAERDQQLIEADGTIKQLLQQVEERDRKLIEADGTLRNLLQLVEERDRRLMEADGTLKQLLQRAEERDRLNTKPVFTS